MIEIPWMQMSGAIAGGVVGSFSGFVANGFHEFRERRRTRRNLASALIGEIGALAYYGEGYLVILREHMRGADDQLYHHFRGERDYMPVYRSIGSNIGLLPTPLPRDLVGWYTGLATGLERAYALHELTVRGNPAWADHIRRLREEQETAFVELLAAAPHLLERLSRL